MSRALEGLDEEQKAAVLALTGPVCIIAGAGTGKTRTVTHRLAHGASVGYVDPRRALAITHSRKAAAELRERLNQLGVGGIDARTFHAAGLRVARDHWHLVARPEAEPTVLSDREEWHLWRESLRRVGRHEPDNAEVRDVMEETGWARSRLVAAGDYSVAAELACRRPGVEPTTVVRCWELFAEAKLRAGRVDFADLLEIASGLILQHVEVAEAVRHRWAHVTVDEYQDTDPAQQRLLEAIMGDGRDICVVGDPRQAIYAWKGADSSYLTSFSRRYPGSQVFNLTRNYRSTPQVLEWANRLAKGGTKPLVANRPGGRNPCVTKLDDEQAEAAWVVARARQAIENGTPPSEIAVLYRFNATQARFEAAFAGCGIPIVVAEDSTFFDREEVRAVLVPFGQAARRQPERNGMEVLTSVLSRVGFDRDRPPPGLGAARARWESHNALVELLEARPAAEGADALTLLAEVNTLAVRTLGAQTEGVTLGTLHKAKGLEWDVVFIVGVTDGAIPSVYAESAAELAEEERLLHVGVTRARQELYLTWPVANAKGWSNRPSPYLDRLSARALPSQGTHQRAPARRDQSAKGSRAAARLHCPHCAQPLKGIAARRLGVCAHCVTSVPGKTGERARALASVIDNAAKEAGLRPEELVSPSATLRLLDDRPDTAEGVVDTVGVGLRGRWAVAAADVLKR